MLDNFLRVNLKYSFSVVEKSNILKSIQELKSFNFGTFLLKKQLNFPLHKAHC